MEKLLPFFWHSRTAGTELGYYRDSPILREKSEALASFLAAAVPAVAGQQTTQAWQAPRWSFCPVRGNQPQPTSGSQKTPAHTVCQKHCSGFFCFITSFPPKPLGAQWASSSITEGLMTFAASPTFVNRNVKSYSRNILNQNVLFMDKQGR